MPGNKHTVTYNDTLKRKLYLDGVRYCIIELYMWSAQAIIHTVTVILQSLLAPDVLGLFIVFNQGIQVLTLWRISKIRSVILFNDY